MFFLKPHWSSCFCQQEAGANVPLQGISTCVYVIYMFHYENGTGWSLPVQTKSKQQISAFVTFWSMLNLNQFSRYCSSNCSTKRNNIILNCTVVCLSILPFLLLSLLLSHSFSQFTTTWKISTASICWCTAVVQKKKLSFHLRVLHSHVHQVLASMCRCMSTNTWH